MVIMVDVDQLRIIHVRNVLVLDVAMRLVRVCLVRVC